MRKHVLERRVREYESRTTDLESQIEQEAGVILRYRARLRDADEYIARLRAQLIAAGLTPTE